MRRTENEEFSVKIARCRNRGFGRVDEKKLSFSPRRFDAAGSERQSERDSRWLVATANEIQGFTFIFKGDAYGKQQHGTAGAGGKGSR